MSWLGTNSLRHRRGSSASSAGPAARPKRRRSTKGLQHNVRSFSSPRVVIREAFKRFGEHCARNQVRSWFRQYHVFQQATRSAAGKSIASVAQAQSDTLFAMRACRCLPPSDSVSRGCLSLTAGLFFRSAARGGRRDGDKLSASSTHALRWPSASTKHMLTSARQAPRTIAPVNSHTLFCISHLRA